MIEGGYGVLVNLQRLLRIARRRHGEGSTAVLESMAVEVR